MALRLSARYRSLLYNSLKFSKTLSSFSLRTHFSTIPPPNPVCAILNSKPILTHSKPYSKPFFPTVPAISSFFKFRGLSSTSLGPGSKHIKVVCTVDLTSLTLEQYEDLGKRLRWRFPLVDPTGLMRRTVRPGEFEDYSRSFLFQKICCGDVGSCYILICTETTDLVGIKGKDKLIIFNEGLFKKKDLVAEVAGVTSVCLLELSLPAESMYAKNPGRDSCNAAVGGLIDLLENYDSNLPMPNYKKLYYGEFLAFVYAFCFKGAVFSWTRIAVELNLARQHLFGSDTGLVPLDNLVSKHQWESMSTEWNLGGKKWTVGGDLELNIEEEVSIVKAAPVVEVKSNTKFNDTTKQREYQKACEDGILDLPHLEKVAAISAWNAVKAGLDVDEFFDEVGYMGEKQVAAARKAWKEATKILHLLEKGPIIKGSSLATLREENEFDLFGKKPITKVSSLANLREGTEGLNLEVEISSSEIVFDRSWGPTFRMARVCICDETGTFVFIARGDQVDILLPGRRVKIFNGRIEKFDDYALSVKWNVGSIEVIT